MNEIVFVVEQEEDGGYIAHAIGQSIFTEADTREALTTNVRDAVRCHFDAPEQMPQQIRLHFIHDELVAL